MRLFHTFALFALAIAASAQVQLSPVPQKANWGDVAISGNIYYTIVGEQTADQDAVRVLNGIINGRTEATDGAKQVKIVIGERGDKAVSAWKSRIPKKAEGYYLSIKKGQIVVAGNDERGTFYGVQTLRQILGIKDEGLGIRIPSVEITDWPDVTERGVVEGFYGNPWSHADRLHQFEFYGQNKMNVYIYGPKDDPYHRDHWRTPYPEDMGSKISELVKAAHDNKVKFVWAVHPGVDIRWIKVDSLAIVNKLESVYDMGVRSFAVFFDDISGEGTKAEKQAGLLNYITDEFVKKHSDVDPLIMCPTQYNKSWSHGDYLPVLGKMTYPEVRIMWTGARVIDMINEEDADWIKERLGRNAYIWLNWPVSDYCVDHLLMGATYDNDLTIADRLSGFVSNPMEYAEASLLSLYSIADYTWHMATYDHQRSWENAIKVLLPGHEEAFHTFCEHNIDLGPNGHGMRRMEESAVLARAIKNGDSEGVRDELVRMVKAARELQAIKGNALVDEIRPWITVMEQVAMRGLMAMNAKKAAVAKDKNATYACAMMAQTLEQEQIKVISRDFPGSIKSPNPRVASLVLEPYIKQIMRDVEHYYRKQWNNEGGLFADPVVDESQYYIVVNGRRMTDLEANPNKIGDYPVFVSYNDSINPARQQWNIRIDAETGRYKITNVQDGRYVNETGLFWQSKGNPYDPSWHTFVINKHENGKYSIQSAGSAGNGYLTVKDDRITRVREERAEFELIKVQ